MDYGTWESSVEAWSKVKNIWFWRIKKPERSWTDSKTQTRECKNKEEAGKWPIFYQQHKIPVNLKNREIRGNGKHCRMWVWKTRNGCKRYLKSLNKTYLKKIGKRPKTSSEIWNIGRRNEHELNWKYPMLECGNTGTDLNQALMQSKGMSDERIVKWTWTKSKKHPMLEFGNTGTDLSRLLKAFSRTKSFMWKSKYEMSDEGIVK